MIIHIFTHFTSNNTNLQIVNSLIQAFINWLNLSNLVPTSLIKQF